MDNAPPSPNSYVISIRVERNAYNDPVWQGVLVTPAGQRLHFSTLAQLNRWLCELSGWRDPAKDAEIESIS